MNKIKNPNIEYAVLFCGGKGSRLGSIGKKKNKSLISFIGAPWTLMVYMFNAKENKKEIDLKKIYKKNHLFNQITQTLTNFLCTHIKNQIYAGADVVQIFDSWAGLIPDENLNDYCFEPNAKIIKFL